MAGVIFVFKLERYLEYSPGRSDDPSQFPSQSPYRSCHARMRLQRQ